MVRFSSLWDFFSSSPLSGRRSKSQIRRLAIQCPPKPTAPTSTALIQASGGTPISLTTATAADPCFYSVGEPIKLDTDGWQIREFGPLCTCLYCTQKRNLRDHCYAGFTK